MYGKHGKMVGDPAPSGGKRGLKTFGETASTKKALAHAGNSAKASQYGRKK